MRSKLVLINKEYRLSRNIKSDAPALVLRGPYEHQIQITKTVTSCELMYDVMIAGEIYTAIPCQYCKKVQ
tara:strand:+ start:587 stop:796 length:210 start_codon:yes stop_codon:yes gene_type:complete